MCYPKPGPRCSAHVRKDLERARAAEQDARRSLGEYVFAHQGADTPEFQELSQRVADATKAVRQTQREYDTTSKGIEELHAHAAKLYAAGAVDDALGDQLLAYIAERRRIRDAQMAAYRQATGKPSAPAATEVAVMDPAEPPACECIDYRFKKTCQHVTELDRPELPPMPAPPPSPEARADQQRRARIAAMSDTDVFAEIRKTAAEANLAHSRGDTAAKEAARRYEKMGYAEATRRGYIPHSACTKPGEPAVLARNGKRVTIHELHFDGSLDVDHGRPRVPLIPATRYSRIDIDDLLQGALRSA